MDISGLMGNCHQLNEWQIMAHGQALIGQCGINVKKIGMAPMAMAHLKSIGLMNLVIGQAIKCYFHLHVA